MLLKRDGGAASGASVKKPAVKATTPEPEDGIFSSIPGMSTPLTSLGESSSLFFGERKIGKTAVAAEFPESVFFMFEPGGEGLSIRKWDITRWAQCLKAVRVLEANRGKFTSVIDTSDKAYELAFKHTCLRMKVEHPSEGEWGNVWKAIDQEFADTMSRIMAASRGTIFISHADVSEFQTIHMDADGALAREAKHNKLVPTMGKQARKFVVGTVSTILYFGYRGEDRFMTLQGSDALEAGTRLKSNFWVAGREGQSRVHSIPMEGSPEVAYANLMAAFRNEQRIPGNPETRMRLGDRPALVDRKRR